MDRRGRVGEDAARELVRDNLRLWKDGRNGASEDLLHMAWFGMQPWVVKLEGEALQALVKLAAVEEGQHGEIFTVLMSISFGAEWELFKLRIEGRWDRAIEMIRHPEIYGAVGDVLDLGWTREVELEEWIEASDRSWGAYEGVKRLLKRLLNSNQPIPGALVQWSMEVAVGARRQPSKGHRPASVTYRDGAIVNTIRDLTASRSQRRAGIKKLTKEMACQLIAEEISLEPDTIQKIWQKGRTFRDLKFIAPAARPFRG